MSYSEIRAEARHTTTPRMCGWCAETIDAGELAWHRVYKFYGDFMDDYMHLECCLALEATDREAFPDGWIPGDQKRGMQA